MLVAANQSGAEMIAADLNCYVKHFETTLRGGNRSTSNVLLEFKWTCNRDTIKLEGYTMRRTNGDVHVEGAFFVTDEHRPSCLPYVEYRDLVDLIACRLKHDKYYSKLHEFVDATISSDRLMIKEVRIDVCGFLKTKRQPPYA